MPAGVAAAAGQYADKLSLATSFAILLLNWSVSALPCRAEPRSECAQRAQVPRCMPLPSYIMLSAFWSTHLPAIQGHRLFQYTPSLKVHKGLHQERRPHARAARLLWP